MRKSILILILGFSFPVSAQIGLRFYQCRPTGELGIYMKKKITAELLYIENESEGFRLRGGISYISFKPRQDTFPVWASSSQNGLTILPGYFVYHKYDLIIGSIGMDYVFLDKEHFHLYPGIDLLAGELITKTNERYFGLEEGSDDVADAVLGFRFRFGGEYWFDDHSIVFVDFNHAIYKTTSASLLAHNEFSIGYRYNF